MARQIVVDIVGDATNFNKTLDATGTKTSSFGDKLKGAFAIAAGATIAVGAITAVGAAVFEAGAKMEAMDAKAQTVFGDSLGRVQKWAKANAAAMGLTQREATGLAANFADLLIPMGFTREAAAEMSEEVIGLSGALSEWSGGTVSAAEVSDILAKAMLGERDGLKALGISITEADVQARLLVNGTNLLTGAALEQAKAQATQQLITEKSTDAQAAYAAGTAKGLRAQHEMEAKLKEVGETLTAAVYPILVSVGGFLADNLPKAIKIAGGIFSWLGKNVIPPLGVAFGIIIEAIKVIIEIISRVIRAFQAMGKVIGAIWGGITTVIKGAVNVIIGIINGVIGAINSLQVHIPKIGVGPVAVGPFDWNGLKIPKLKYLHAGGIVPGMPGSEVPTMLQAGEQVIPRNQVGSGGITVNFYGPVFAEEAWIDDFTRKIAMRIRTAA